MAQAAAAINLDDADAPFLGVRRSAKGYIWRERLAGPERGSAVAMAQRYDLPELLGRVLAGRGVPVDDAETFLDPTIKALMPDPSSVLDMDVAAARLADAIANKQKIAIFGDYDVDGACSSALMQLFLGAHGLGCRVYIPDRIFEGYGPNPAAMEQLARDGAELIVTVDCGTTSFEPLAVAEKLGVEVIVVDHHQADETLPAAVAVVNPNRQDDLSGLGQLCAAGVVFLLLVAVSRELRRRGHYEGCNPPDLLGFLDIVALATVCDVVPLTGLNRAYVTKGLQVMRTRQNAGLRALFDAAGLNQAPTTYHLGFVLGPRINAGGRIGDSGLGARLLATSDAGEAAKHRDFARQAQSRTQGDRDRDARMKRSAEADVMVDQDPDTAIVMLGSEAWHKGVVGLVASRLTDRFRRPSCVIAWDDKGAGTGFAAVGGGSRYRLGGARGDRRGHFDQGRRPCDGGRVDGGKRDKLDDLRGFHQCTACAQDDRSARDGQPGARWGLDAGGGDARLDRPAGAGRPLWPGQSATEIRVSSAPGQIR